MQLFLGDELEARALAEETLAALRESVDMSGAASWLAVGADALGIREEFGEIVTRAPEGPWKELLLAGAEGNVTRVADLYDSFGAPTFGANARLAACEILLASGRPAEGEAQVRRALDFFRTVDARFFVEKAEALLAQVQRESA